METHGGHRDSKIGAVIQNTTLHLLFLCRILQAVHAAGMWRRRTQGADKGRALGRRAARLEERGFTMESINRRNFVGAMGAMAAMGAGSGTLADFLSARQALAAETAEGPNEDGFVFTDEGQTEAAKALAADTTNPVTGNGNTEPLRAGIEGVRGSANPMFQGPANPVFTEEEAREWIANQPMVTEPYTTPSGKVIPAAYINLRNRWNRQGLGLGSNVEDGDDYWDWLMYNFSEREAMWYCMMPFPGIFSAAEFAAKIGFSEYECGEVCDTLAMKGLLIRNVHGGVPYYFCVDLAFGHIQKWDDPEYLHGWTTMYAPMAAQEAVDSGTKTYSTMPVSVDVCANNEIVSPFDDWQAIINRNSVFVIDPCACKTLHLASQGDFRYLSDPDARLTDGHEDRVNICLAMGELAEYYIWKGVGRQVTKDEAMASVQQSMEEGLVIEHFYDSNTEVICQCRCDQCAILGPQKALAGQGDAIFAQSDYKLTLDKDKCIQCGACIERCPMEAITFGEDGYPQMGPECAVCGQCAYVCPAGARVLELKPVEQQIDFPHNVVDDWNKKAIYRRMKGSLYDFLPSDTVSADEMFARSIAKYGSGIDGTSKLPKADGPLMTQATAEAKALDQKQPAATVGKE